MPSLIVLQNLQPAFGEELVLIYERHREKGVALRLTDYGQHVLRLSGAIALEGEPHAFNFPQEFFVSVRYDGAVLRAVSRHQSALPTFVLTGVRCSSADEQRR